MSLNDRGPASNQLNEPPAVNKRGLVRRLPRRERIRELEKGIEQLHEQSQNAQQIPLEPVEFAEKILNFKPSPYQSTILSDKSKRIAVRICRQGGKTTVIAARAIWFAVTHPNTTTVIIAPSQRQSIIMMDTIHGFIFTINDKDRRTILKKALRTTIYLKNGSRIIALPNNPKTVRGYTADQAICFPSHIKILMADGTETQISNVVAGQRVLSCKLRTNQIEAQRIIEVSRK